MGGCSAPFCNNSAAKGYKMKALPKDPVRRALWIKNIANKDWTPTNNSRLCEVHFSPEMWDDISKHKLKRDAILTIFYFFLKKQIPIKAIENDGNTDCESNVLKITSSTQSIKCTNKKATNNIENEKTIIETVIVDDISGPMASSANMSSISDSYENEKEEYKKYKQLVKKQYLRLIIMRKKMKTLQYRNRILKSKIDNDKYKKALSHIFNEDKSVIKKNSYSKLVKCDNSTCTEIKICVWN
ncbi:PREDICTED: THAP domain-containing protein 2-like isoform X1 [Trachymyrmex cornetzi]|uniref:THAP domain-containing protein 2-like isoform X1 n=1 Tax=Trachymyrmex cornetzi TaxID=471704 RepID=UPI00084F7706|nr:PREDICTED: THAP domain-containing protein 2-like isoform X1 [Trachymyrmex cornetzi]XP_018357371.1 PREDICTED: THAP domain-containing protein 2-like isoform X1 [Trachymyrmex cornetzi]